MPSLHAIKQHLKSRLGDLWWYTAVFFVVQRFGDAINAFIGLWLVPRYVPQEELGALLALVQGGRVPEMPRSIRAMVFTDNVRAPAFHGGIGKVESLPRGAFSLASVFPLAPLPLGS